MSRSSRNSSDNHPDQNKRKVYGRRIGRPLGKEQSHAIDTLLPRFAVPANLLTEQGALDPVQLFPEKPDRIVMEIGFGNGEHLLALMEREPQTGFLGAEPFINGMAAFLKVCGLQGRENVRVLMDDALLLVHSLTDSCLDRLYVLNPDPWPKTRHHKRRIISRENLDAFARVLKPGCEIVMATDVDELAEWMVTQCMNHPAFEWTAQSAKDWKTPPPEWIETRYAFKGKTAGRNQTFLVFRKKTA